MKKTILLLVAVAISSISFAATKQRTILSHQGVLTQYDLNHWYQAIEDAAAGDTVYFTSGSFGDDNVNANLVISKPITLIGAGVAESDAFFKEDASIYGGCATSGESTILRTNVTIAIPGSIMLTSTLMEGFVVPSRYGFEPTVNITEPVTGLTIKRCQIENSFSTSAKLTNCVLEGCYFYRLSTNNMENPDIHNCIIGNLYSGSEEIEITNCQVSGGIEGTKSSAFVNCIMGSLPDYNTYINCTYWQSGNSTLSNCWAVSWGMIPTKEQLQENGYLGTDDTIIGPLGGLAPFTLVPSQPYVSSSSLTYLKASKKLNVNVTVKQGK